MSLGKGAQGGEGLGSGAPAAGALLGAGGGEGEAAGDGVEDVGAGGRQGRAGEDIAIKLRLIASVAEGAPLEKQHRGGKGLRLGSVQRSQQLIQGGEHERMGVEVGEQGIGQIGAVKGQVVGVEVTAQVGVSFLQIPFGDGGQFAGFPDGREDLAMRQKFEATTEAGEAAGAVAFGAFGDAGELAVVLRENGDDLTGL